MSNKNTETGSKTYNNPLSNSYVEAEQKWNEQWNRLKLPSGHNGFQYEVGEKCVLYGYGDKKAIPVKITKLFYNGTYEVVDTNGFYYRTGDSNLDSIYYYIYCKE